MSKNFLYKNLVWSLNKNVGDDLVTMPTTEKQYVEQLYKLAENYYPERKQVNATTAEFYLNQVALCRAKLDAVKLAKEHFENFWSAYLKLKNTFERNYLTFPSNGTKTRIEIIAELITKCCQFAVSEQTLRRLAETAKDVMQFDEREERYLTSVIDLYKICFYCKATLSAAKGNNAGSVALAKMLRPALLKQNYNENKKYCQCAMGNNRLISVIDCMGSSISKFDDITTKINTKLYVYANGRNVFDTFTKSRFGNNVCEFKAQGASIECNMRYFTLNSAEIRNIALTNNSKIKRKFTVEIVTKRDGADAAYFNMDGTLCLAVDNERLYAATALLEGNDIVSYYGDNTQNYDFYLLPNEQKEFDIVTLYSHDSPSLAHELDNLRYFGATACPYVCDTQSQTVRHSDITLNLSSHGYALKKPRKVMSTRLNYTYQLGNADTATFVDNAGNSTTLIKGFVFGVGGESVYSARGGLIDKINEGDFNIDVDCLRYDKAKSCCVIRHDDGKIYEVSHKNACKTLFLFPFECKSTVKLNGNVFTVEDIERDYEIECFAPIDSYTTNALECNEEKLRYKLSNDLNTGSCLVICLATADNVKLKITSKSKTPVSSPIIRESLVSTYLNYINDKNTFCIANYIKRPEALTVAAICYTNPQFVKNYLQNRFKTQQTGYYYDLSGQKKTYTDKLTFPLAYAYYRNLVGDDLPKSYLNAVNGTVFGEEFCGKELCVKALILKKLAQLNTDDKVRYLVEYNKLKKTISNDSKLYAYAQAIGALTMINPSKARLKDLCNNYEIPKSWYYVSQLENLYGLTISPDRLHVCPKITAENVLEQFAININGKRIDTTFSKATVQSMTLNGTQCFQPFCPSSLKNANNELVVRY